MLPLILTLFGTLPEGQIAYLSGDTPEERCVYVVDLASGERTKVGPGNGDGAPRWSPDGAWIAFDTRTDSGRGIGLTRPDGSEGRYLDHQYDWNEGPRWSPDGRRLAFSAGRGMERVAVVYNLDKDEESVWGGGRTGLMRPAWFTGPLLPAQLLGGEELDPILARDIETAGALAAVGLTGTPEAYRTDVFVVTRGRALALSPELIPPENPYVEWAAEPSPRDSSLAFESNDGGDRELFIARGGDIFDVSNHRAADWNPRWEPRAKWIAFESMRSGRLGIYRVHRDTNRVLPIAADDASDNFAPTWSPEGRWLGYVSTRGGIAAVYITDANGDAHTRVTWGEARAFAPAWRPVTP